MFSHAVARPLLGLGYPSAERIGALRSAKRLAVKTVSAFIGVKGD